MKAIVLYSGGLDSRLALALLQRLNIETLPLMFLLPFNRLEEARAGYQPDGLRVVELGEAYLDLLQHPRHGRGKHLNACVDCHLFMLQKAKALLSEWGADFVATGEVLGQRPMSQHRQSLELISRESGLDGLLLRPLSAQLLHPTVPETSGWVPRAQLLAIRGRGRKEQYALAEAWGIRDYNSPAGGCLMTDKSYCAKVERLIAGRMLTPANMQWIRYGRFFDLGPAAKLVVARNERECQDLENTAQPGDRLLHPSDTSGPTAILRGLDPESVLMEAAAIVAHYCRKHGTNRITARLSPAGGEQILICEPASLERVRERLVA